MTPSLDLTDLRARCLRATTALLRELVQGWPANGTLEGRFGPICLKKAGGDAPEGAMELEILVDGRALAARLDNSQADEPRRLRLPAAIVTPQDAALFLLSAVAQATGRTTRLLYRPFHEVYEADADGQLRLVGTMTEEDATDRP